MLVSRSVRRVCGAVGDDVGCMMNPSYRLHSVVEDSRAEDEYRREGYNREAAREVSRRCAHFGGICWSPVVLLHWDAAPAALPQRINFPGRRTKQLADQKNTFRRPAHWLNRVMSELLAGVTSLCNRASVRAT